MAQHKPEYTPVPEFRKYAEQLVNKYPEVLDGIKPALLTCVAVTNKEPKEGKPLWELKPVTYPFRLDLNYDYYVVVNASDWNGMDEKHQALLTFDVLCSLDREQPGKVVPFDLKDHSVVIRTVGPDYMRRNNIPDIIKDNIEWKTEPA